jgi:hypothetical protein
MNTVKIMAIVLIVSCSLGLVYGGFTYIRGTPHEAKLSPIELSINDTQILMKDAPIDFWQPHTGICPSLTVNPQSKTISIHYEIDSTNNGEKHGNLI